LKVTFTWPSNNFSRSNQWHLLMAPFKPYNFCLKYFFLKCIVYEIFDRSGTFLTPCICNKDILLVPISGEIIDKVRQKKLADVHRRYHCGHKKVGYKMNWKLMHEHGKVFSQTKREYRLPRDIFGLLSSSTGNICLLRIYANISAHWKKKQLVVTLLLNARNVTSNSYVVVIC